MFVLNIVPDPPEIVLPLLFAALSVTEVAEFTVRIIAITSPPVCPAFVMRTQRPT
jgi:hypothetical protein